MVWLNWVIVGYPIVINVAAVCLTVHDKRAAVKRKRRVPEKKLMLVTALGGGVGMYLTMYAVRHKTKHLKFVIGVPVITILETAAVITLICLYH